MIPYSGAVLRFLIFCEIIDDGLAAGCWQAGWHKHFNPDKKTVFITLFGPIRIKIGVLNTPAPPRYQ